MGYLDSYMDDFGTRSALEKAIKLMDQKLNELTQMPDIPAKEVWGLTQIGSTLARIDKHLRDYEEEDPYARMSDDELTEMAKRIVGKD